MALVCNYINFPKRKRFYDIETFNSEFIPLLYKKRGAMLNNLCALKLLKLLIEIFYEEGGYYLTFKLYKTIDIGNYRFFYYHFYISDDFDDKKKILLDFVEQYSLKLL